MRTEKEIRERLAALAGLAYQTEESFTSTYAVALEWVLEVPHATQRPTAG